MGILPLSPRAVLAPEAVVLPRAKVPVLLLAHAKDRC